MKRTHSNRVIVDELDAEVGRPFTPTPSDSLMLNGDTNGIDHKKSVMLNHHTVRTQYSRRRSSIHDQQDVGEPSSRSIFSKRSSSQSSILNADPEPRINGVAALHRQSSRRLSLQRPASASSAKSRILGKTGSLESIGLPDGIVPTHNSPVNGPKRLSQSEDIKKKLLRSGSSVLSLLQGEKEEDKESQEKLIENEVDELTDSLAWELAALGQEVGEEIKASLRNHDWGPQKLADCSSIVENHAPIENEGKKLDTNYVQVVQLEENESQKEAWSQITGANHFNSNEPQINSHNPLQTSQSSNSTLSSEKKVSARNKRIKFADECEDKSLVTSGSSSLLRYALLAHYAKACHSGASTQFIHNMIKEQWLNLTEEEEQSIQREHALEEARNTALSWLTFTPEGQSTLEVEKLRIMQSRSTIGYLEAEIEAKSRIMCRWENHSKVLKMVEESIVKSSKYNPQSTNSAMQVAPAVLKRPSSHLLDSHPPVGPFRELTKKEIFVRKLTFRLRREDSRFVVCDPTHQSLSPGLHGITESKSKCFIFPKMRRKARSQLYEDTSNIDDNEKMHEAQKKNKVYPVSDISGHNEMMETSG